MAKRIGEKDNKLLHTIIGAIYEKKGKHVDSIDLRCVEHAACDFFIICEGQSAVQVSAIAEGILRKARNSLGERPWHIEGKDNAEWILIDYVNIVVHVFQEDVRYFYNLEELWADGIKTKHQDPAIQALKESV